VAVTGARWVEARSSMPSWGSSSDGRAAGASGDRPFGFRPAGGARIVLSADTPERRASYAGGVVTDSIRSLWAEPRAPGPPGPAPRDWLLVATCILAATVETLARPEIVWRSLSLALVVALALALPWRRARPLAVLAITIGTLSTIHAVAIARDVDWEGLGSTIFVILVPYALARWGSGREVAGGLGILVVPITLTAVGGGPIGDIVGGALVLLLAVALGAGARYHHATRRQELDALRSRERELLARELHDTVAHHVSAIAISAQAGRAVAEAKSSAATDALTVIEEEASRTLEEMRAIVGALRNAGRAELTPQPGLADIRRLARTDGRPPCVEVEVSGELTDLGPAVEAALYRLAREAVTNAVRHARRATVVRVRVWGERHDVRLTVDDDGVGAASPGNAGFGLVGMAERAKLLGGTFEAGARPNGGWSVSAVLPRHGASP
jgi:signal transduction histidine kinase